MEHLFSFVIASTLGCEAISYRIKSRTRHCRPRIEAKRSKTLKTVAVKCCGFFMVGRPELFLESQVQSLDFAAECAE